MMANAKLRPGYYGHQPIPPVVGPEEPQPVEGADEIAAVVKLRPKQIYRMVEAAKRGQMPAADAIPVRKVPGVGLVGDRVQLLRWYDRVVRGIPAA
jgi:hypothetical protein